MLRGDFLGAHPQAVPEVGLGYFGSEEVICAIEYQWVVLLQFYCVSSLCCCLQKQMGDRLAQVTLPKGILYCSKAFYSLQKHCSATCDRAKILMLLQLLLSWLHTVNPTYCGGQQMLVVRQSLAGHPLMGNCNIMDLSCRLQLVLAAFVCLGYFFPHCSSIDTWIIWYSRAYSSLCQHLWGKKSLHLQVE